MEEISKDTFEKATNLLGLFIVISMQDRRDKLGVVRDSKTHLGFGPFRLSYA